MRAVVSFANGQYISKMARLEESLKGKTDAVFMGFNSYDQIGCKPHNVIPYQFKPYAIQAAIDKGADIVLWCDSPIHAVKYLSPVFEFIEEYGYMFFNNIGHPLGKWTNQKCLDWFGYTREQANEIYQIMACCMGFDFRQEYVRNLFADYYRYSEALYPGPWSEHRHDQTVMSFLLYDHGFNIMTGHETFFAYEEHRGILPFADSIALISGGS